MPINHFVSLKDGKTLTTTYRSNKENILAANFKGSNILPHCETFDRSAFDTVLAQTGCNAIRIYLGMGTDLKVHCVIVGVDENNEDMLPGENDFQIIEEGIRCPEDCPPPSDLNT